MSFVCVKCDTKLSCLETRSLEDHIYRRYRCRSCGMTVRTQEVCTSVETESRKVIRKASPTVQKLEAAPPKKP